MTQKNNFFLKILFRAYNFIIKCITRSLIIFKKPRKMTNDFFNNYTFIHTLHWTSSECLTNVAIGFLKMIKLLVILFIVYFFCFYNLRQKNLAQSKRIKQNWTAAENFNNCFYLIFDCCDKIFISERKTSP